MGNRIKEVFILQLHLTLYDSHFTVGYLRYALCALRYARCW